MLPVINPGAGLEGLGVYIEFGNLCLKFRVGSRSLYYLDPTRLALWGHDLLVSVLRIPASLFRVP